MEKHSMRLAIGKGNKAPWFFRTAGIGLGLFPALFSEKFSGFTTHTTWCFVVA